MLLEVENLKTWLESDTGSVRAVDEVTFTIQRGQTVCLLGESGCGKSMTALSIARLLPEAGKIVGGKVKLADIDLLLLPEAAMRNVRGLRIGMIFQEPATSLNPVLTIYQQIAEALERHTPLRGDEIRQRVIELLNAVGMSDVERRLYEYPFQLSGGLKQRVMIAIALTAKPDLLLADEPTTALDATIQSQVLDLLRALQQKNNMALLLITHDLGVVARMAHNVALMYAGHIIEWASRENFFRDPKHPYAKKLFASLPNKLKRGTELDIIHGSVPPLTKPFSGCRFADRCDYAWERCHNEVPGWTRISDTQQVRCHLYSVPSFQFPVSSLEASARSAQQLETRNQKLETVLSVSHLKVHFPIRKGVFKRTVGYVKAVDDVSFEIKKGQTLALVGESGCGKTTVGKRVLGLVPPTSGKVTYQDIDLTSLSKSQWQTYRAHLQIVFQDPYSSLNPRMRIADILEEGMIALGIGTSEGRRARIKDLLNQVGLDTTAMERYPHEFSGGQRQRIAIARALSVNPKLIICDEPTSALDVSVQAQILNLLKQLQNNLGLSYLFITHNISVVEYLAHEIAVMHQGRIVEQGDAEKILTAPQHAYTKTLLASAFTIN